jgi:hypothetical protein
MILYRIHKLYNWTVKPNIMALNEQCLIYNLVTLTGKHPEASDIVNLRQPSYVKGHFVVIQMSQAVVIDKRLWLFINKYRTLTNWSSLEVVYSLYTSQCASRPYHKPK